MVTGSDRERTAAFLTRYHQMLEEQYPLQENGQICWHFRVCLLLPAVRSNYHVTGNGDREEFSLEFLLHRSSVQVNFNSVADGIQR